MSAGLGGIKTSVQKEISPTGEIPLEVGLAYGTMDLLGNGALTYMAG